MDDELSLLQPREIVVPAGEPGQPSAAVLAVCPMIASAVVRITSAAGAIGLGNIDPSPGYSLETIDQSLRAPQETNSAQRQASTGTAAWRRASFAPPLTPAMISRIENE